MINKILKIIHEYFAFNKREKNGFLVLSILLLIIVLIRLAVHQMQPYPNIKIQSFEISDKIKALKLSETKNSYSNSKRNYFYSKKDNRYSKNSDRKSYGTSGTKAGLNQSVKFNFDPNIISKQEAMQLGFSDKQSNILINFRNKGGHFSSAQDLKVLYGMTQKLFSEVEPFVQIDPAFSRLGKLKKDPLKKAIERIEINTADSVTLLKVKGIGPVFAKKIIKKRESFGGYYSLQQLKEINGMKDSMFEIITSQLSIDTVHIRKLNFNSSFISELEKHPYVGKKLAAIVKNYRLQHGDYYKLEDVKKTGVFSDELLNKLKPYLIFR